jgi:hypothetical protein
VDKSISPVRSRHWPAKENAMTIATLAFPRTRLLVAGCAAAIAVADRNRTAVTPAQRPILLWNSLFDVQPGRLSEKSVDLLDRPISVAVTALHA